MSASSEPRDEGPCPLGAAQPDQCDVHRAVPDLLLGRCTPEAARRLAPQVAACVPCRAAAARVPGGDPLVEALRQPTGTARFVDESECGEAVRQARALAVPLPGTGSFNREGSDSATRRQTSPAADLLPPFIGKYKVLRRLGGGGMGTVYLALHPQLEKQVAVKVIRRDLVADETAALRFQREMRLLARLDHPHVVRATDADIDDGCPFLVMDYIEGEDLRRIVDRRGPLPLAEALELIRQAALGLAYAHGLGFVHRDVKHENLLVSQQGEVKVLDLGLARFVQDDASKAVTKTGEFFGTLDFMAPEQWQSSHDIDGRADIYALGCTLFFVLTGKTPFDQPGLSTRVAKLQAHAHVPPPRVSDRRPEVPSAVDELVDRMLAKKPEQRPQSAREVADALERILDQLKTGSLRESREASSGSLRSASAVPEMIGRYTVIERIGDGGMGTVYKGLHPQLGNFVAIKLIRGDRIKSPAAAAQFEKEMRVLAQLSHPNIVRATDADLDRGVPFLVMEYLEGETLRELVERRGRLPVSEACQILREAALGLAYAHERNFVHRDVKHDNLFITTEGHVKLLDLGLARLVEGGAAPASGEMVGTVDFCSPEQFNGQSDLDARSDLYSLGCTLYYALTGQVPFGPPQYATVTQKMMAHCTKPPVPIRQLRSDVPVGVQKLLDRMLAKPREDRPAKAQEVAELLAPYCQGVDSALHGDVAAAQPAPRTVRRWLPLAAAVGLVGLLAAAVTAMPGLLRGSGARSPDGGSNQVATSGGGQDPGAAGTNSAGTNSKEVSKPDGAQAAEKPGGGAVPPPKVVARLADFEPRQINEEQEFQFDLKEFILGRETVSEPLGFTTKGAVPRGLIVNKDGVLKWTPREADGPGEYTIEIELLQGGRAVASKPLTLAVVEINKPPVLELAVDRLELDEQKPIVRDGWIKLSDPDRSPENPEGPSQKLTVSLENAPEWIRVDPLSGKLTAEPGENDGPGEYTFTVVVTDDDPASPLSARKDWTAAVKEINVAPQILAASWRLPDGRREEHAFPPDEPLVRTVALGGSLELEIAAADADRLRDADGNLLEQRLAFTLLPPANLTRPERVLLEPLADGKCRFRFSSDARLDADPSTGGGPYEFTIRVADDADPPLQHAVKVVVQLDRFQEVALAPGLSLKLAYIPEGTATIGTKEVKRNPAPAPANPGNPNAPTPPAPVASDNPPLKVRISKPFYLGVYEVSQAEFQQVTNANPSSFQGGKTPAGVSAGDLPVEQVTHSAAVAFCDKLTDLHGKALGLKFRLPYEVEWEYACRAGSDQPFCFGAALTPEQAVFNARAPRPVRLAGAPNGFHLVGMHGNVAEWCADRYHAETYRNARPEEDGYVVDLRGPKTGTLAVLRGGSWSDKLIPNQPAASNLSAATRMSGVMESRLDRWGFRVAAEIVESNGAAPEPSADR